MAGARSKRDFLIFFALLLFTLFIIKFQLYDVEELSPVFGHKKGFLNELDEYCNKDTIVDGIEGNLGKYFLLFFVRKCAWSLAFLTYFLY
jgi:hypothetical protein